ncbi:hypothetical protein H4S06_003073 [Coemansia sp. BCRC 34490]|nr:hypothetical protein GGI11_006313 [Coemansia sp. RSA 2049]KAJ2517140.1 hypothetical protein H4217_004141 [Coemansia sp. RSA 1939]KAJ2610763.1 hypothetical protein EV177_003817 [Coemansia sp. RSA 1804]KAJ2757662.1 hypothetical protein H4S06_003073 [Coemansia sp. BCRC 34490]
MEDGSVFVSRVPKTMPEISEADLPPLVREDKPAQRKELTNELIQSLIALRNEDPAQWTVSKLAKKFDIPKQLVLALAPCPQWRRDDIQKAKDSEWENLGYKKRLIRLNRIRRRLMW